ncbi:unnamed protein product [Euphydryas editha]|uniref:Uncharacterized protein n=1 Tax=Euphydryas editha TaxID=104508 RepID=A0AAU9TZB0_EUPED|nr:unnamed protein product [Euphydryas editha]
MNHLLVEEIKIWEVKEKIERKYKLINGDSVPGFVKESITVEVFNKNIPSNKPRIFRADPNSSSLEINYIKPDVLNEIRIQSYKQNEDGEYSEPWRLKVFKEFRHNAVGHKHMEKCMGRTTEFISCSSEVEMNIVNHISREEILRYIHC